MLTIDSIVGNLTIIRRKINMNNTNEMFYRIDENGNAQIFNNDGSTATQINANVYVVGSDGSKSVRYEHPEGIFLTVEDAEKIGVHRE